MVDAFLHAAPQLRAWRNEDSCILELDSHLHGHEHFNKQVKQHQQSAASFPVRLAGVSWAGQGCMLLLAPRADA